jgi:MYXO-CTERM domain-containing protein
MKKLILAIFLLSATAPFAAAQYGNNGGGRNIKYPPQKQHGHAPEMSTTAMAVAGVIGLGGYLLIRRRASWQS